MAEEPDSPPERSRWKDLAILLAVAVVTVVGLDRIASRVSPPRHQREILHAAHDYEHEDPTVLVLGSSHARTFGVVDQVAQERVGDKVRVLDIPLEWGKFRSYEWVLQNRLRPFIEESEGGKLKRPSLRHFILQTAWWDACALDSDPPVFNIPSRAWTFKQFSDSLVDKGLNDYNRNYVTSRWIELFEGSTLVTDRGHGHLLNAVRDKVKPISEEGKKARFENKLESWQSMIDRGSECMGHKKELEAAQRIIDYAKGRGYDVTILLYPMMPVTFTEFARSNVQAPFFSMMKDLADKNGVRFIDNTFDTPLVDSDYQPDFDHLTPAGHRKYSEFLVDGPLRFIFEDAPQEHAHADVNGSAP